MKGIKQVVILYENAKPIRVMEIKNIQSFDELHSIERQCINNLKEIYDEQQEKEQRLLNRLNELENRLLKAETELAYNRGEIDEEEYERVCHGN